MYQVFKADESLNISIFDFSCLRERKSSRLSRIRHVTKFKDGKKRFFPSKFQHSLKNNLLSIEFTRDLTSSPEHRREESLICFSIKFKQLLTFQVLFCLRRFQCLKVSILPRDFQIARYFVSIKISVSTRCLSPHLSLSTKQSPRCRRWTWSENESLIWMAASTQQKWDWKINKCIYIKIVSGTFKKFFLFAPNTERRGPAREGGGLFERENFNLIQLEWERKMLLSRQEKETAARKTRLKIFLVSFSFPFVLAASSHCLLK